MMALIHDVPGRPSSLHQRVVISTSLEVDVVDAGAADSLAARIVACARDLDHEGPLRIECGHDAMTGRLQVRCTGGFAALEILEARASDGQPAVNPDTPVRVAVAIGPVRYELSVAMHDHLLNASRNHPQGRTPLQVDSQYDEEGENLQVTISGSLFAAGYLLMLIHLQLTQSRFADRTSLG